MRLRLAILAVALLAGVSTRASAQGKWGGFGYDWSVGAGDLKSYIENDSWLGFTLEGRSFASERLSIGGMIGYYAFYENTTDLIELPQGAVSGQQYRHITSVPIMANLFLYTAPRAGRRFYVGGHVGVYYLRQLLDIGAYSFIDDAWIFGAAPEAGFVLPVKGQTMTLLHVRYNYPMDGGNFLSGQSRSMQYWSIGLSFMGRKY